MATGKPGRPSKKTPELCAEICERLSTGEPLTVICRSSDAMPDPANVWRWTEEDEEFSQAIARARKLGFDAIAEECRVIADTPMVGVRTETMADGTVKEVREDMLGHRKLQIETRLKLLAKWDPKRYGERVHTELSGPDGGPIQSETTLDLSTLPDEQLRALAGIPIPPR